MWRVRSTGELSWCRAVRVRSGLVLFNSRIEREHESSPRAAESDRQIASRAGADDVLLTDEKLVEGIRKLAADGVGHIVEVAFAANIKTDVAGLAQGGSIATYATSAPSPEGPVWQLVFMNARLFFVGSDDVPADARIDATRDINHAFEAGWQGLEIAEVIKLDQIARTHELVEHPVKPGRAIVAISGITESETTPFRVAQPEGVLKFSNC